MTGCFRTTNFGAQSMESGLRAAVAQLENPRRRAATEEEAEAKAEVEKDRPGLAMFTDGSRLDSGAARRHTTPERVTIFTDAKQP